MKTHWALRLPLMLAIGAIAVTAFSALVMLLWNWLGPALFHLPMITLVQAFGLFVLCRILFGGFGGGGRGKHHWKRRMRERFERMTPEERERFRRGLGDSAPSAEG